MKSKGSANCITWSFFFSSGAQGMDLQCAFICDGGTTTLGIVVKSVTLWGGGGGVPFCKLASKKNKK